MEAGNTHKTEGAEYENSPGIIGPIGPIGPINPVVDPFNP